MPPSPRPPTMRDRVLAHLADHPGTPVRDLAAVLGLTRDRYASHTVCAVMHRLEQVGQAVADLEYDPVAGKPVKMWRLAPPGTQPRPELRDRLARRRERDRLAKQRQRARTIGAPEPAPLPPVSTPRRPAALTLAALPGAACAGADPDLFFPVSPTDAAQAKAVCAGCPVRAACLAAALQRGERYGVFGGKTEEERQQIIRSA